MLYDVSIIAIKQEDCYYDTDIIGINAMILMLYDTEYTLIRSTRRLL